MKQKEKDSETRDQLKLILVDSMFLHVPDDYQVRYPGYKIDEWGVKADTFISELQKLVVQ